VGKKQSSHLSSDHAPRLVTSAAICCKSPMALKFYLSCTPRQGLIQLILIAKNPMEENVLQETNKNLRSCCLKGNMQQAMNNMKDIPS